MWCAKTRYSLATELCALRGPGFWYLEADLWSDSSGICLAPAVLTTAGGRGAVVIQGRFLGGSSSLSSSLVSSVSKWCAIDNLKSRSFSRCFLGTSRSWQSSLYCNHEGVRSFRKSGWKSGAPGTSGRTDVNRAPCLQGGSLPSLADVSFSESSLPDDSENF